MASAVFCRASPVRQSDAGAARRGALENRPGRHRGGRALPQERLRRGASPAPRPVRAASGRDGAGARRSQRPVHRAPPTAAAKSAGIKGRITGHSGRVGLASELTARGASTTETMLAGGWKTARMVAHYSAVATAEQGAVAKYL